MAALVNYNHAKNAKSALNKLFERLKKQQNLAAAGSSSDGADRASPEADDGDEEAEDSPKKKSLIKKSTRAKKSEEDAEATDDEDSSKKPTAKKVTTKKAASVKKGVGKTTAPKKASSGGPKTPIRGKGKKSKIEEPEAKAEAEQEADVNDASAKAEGDDDADMEDLTEEEAGKSSQSLTQSSEIAPLPTPALVTIPTNLLPGFVAPPAPPKIANPTRPLLEMIIQGYVYYYTPWDQYIADSHGISIREWLQFKETSDHASREEAWPYDVEEAQARGLLKKTQSRTESSTSGPAAWYFFRKIS